MKARTSSTVSEQPEAGTHIARLVGITDLGLQPGFEWQGKEIKPSYKLRLTYELVSSEMSDGRPFHVHEDVTNSDSSKGTLYLRVKALKGDFNQLTAMLGNPCMVTLVIDRKGYAKVDGQGAVSGVPAGIPVPELRNEPFVFDLSDPNIELFNTFPQFIQDRITGNLNYSGSQLEKRLAEGAEY